MDTLLPILCLAVGIALPVAALFFAVRRGSRQLAVANAYQHVARARGLPVDTRGVSLQGHLGERRIWIGQVMVGHGAERRIEVRGVLTLSRPLGLGLLIRHKPRGRGSSRALPLAHLELGKGVEVQGDDLERVEALLAPVRADLHALFAAWPTIECTDRDVRVRLKQPLSQVAGLGDLVDQLVAVADALEKSRLAVPAPVRLKPLLPAWTALAERRGLHVVHALPAMDGDIEGLKVVIATRRATAGYAAELVVWFPSSLDLGLRLRPQVEPDGYWSVGQDIQVGNATFDDAFVIKGWDPRRIRHLLTADAMAGLLELVAVGPVEVDDRRLQLRSAPLDAAELEMVLDAAIRTARALTLT